MQITTCGCIVCVDGMRYHLCADGLRYRFKHHWKVERANIRHQAKGRVAAFQQCQCILTLTDVEAHTPASGLQSMCTDGTQVENVEMLDNNQIKFDFLGKDSIRYENVVDVEPEVWKNMKDFKAKDRNGAKKKPEDQLFDTMNATV
jgi:hypothetical protein